MQETLPEDVQRSLRERSITRFDEVTLRQELEAHVATYTLFKLADWPARRWKCRYRVMMSAGTYDGQSAAEAYARALLAALQSESKGSGEGT